MNYYDPRGVVDAPKLHLAQRPASLSGLRVGVLDNTKWNGWKLEQRITALLQPKFSLGQVTRYQKESFSRVAAPELLEKIAAESDVVLTGIGD